MIKYSVYGHIMGILHALTQLLNAILGSCDSHESTSERAFNDRHESFFWTGMYHLINTLAFRESNHCAKAQIKRVRWCEMYLKYASTVESEIEVTRESAVNG